MMKPCKDIQEFFLQEEVSKYLKYRAKWSLDWFENPRDGLMYFADKFLKDNLPEAAVKFNFVFEPDVYTQSWICNIHFKYPNGSITYSFKIGDEE